MQTSINLGSAISGATDLLPFLRPLQNHEKLFLIQFLVADLSRQQQSFILPDEVYPIWSPHDSYDAAEIMLQALATSKDTK
jgi:hypothetical protein